MKSAPFDRNKHVYQNEAFTELIKDAVRFFNGTPVQALPPAEIFPGAGVYALYYTGTNKLYKKYADLNRLSYGYPIYVGKAVPKGWRQARVFSGVETQSHELHLRLKEHSRNIANASDLFLEEFTCRFVIFEQEGSGMIGTIESALIQLHKPLWNVALDGFGNHDPGSGRYEQAKSDWDVIHVGRSWAAKCNGIHTEKDTIIRNIEHHLATIG
ncbi:MAG: Eco29kI family restriction endonuclease [Magnetococcus sp. YQC-3]